MLRLARSLPPVRLQPCIRTLLSSRRVNKAMSEAEASAAAAGAAQTDGPTIFDKIIDKSIPADVIFEDDTALAFRDINPTVKSGLSRLSKATEENAPTLGHLLYVAQKIAKQEGLTNDDPEKDGFRVVINDGPLGCQSVYHLHLHVIGGRKGTWPAF